MEVDTTHGAARRPASEPEVLKGLNDLLQLDHDAVGAYEIAIDKLDDRSYAEQIRGFKTEHERHIRNLNELITKMGGSPTNEPHATGPFKEAVQSVAGLGGDKGLLMAWRTNELQTRTKYDSYASKANSWPSDVKRVVDENALDEERHYQWVVDALETLGVSSGGGSGDPVSAVREQLATAGSKVQDVAEGARERIVSGFDTVVHKIEEVVQDHTQSGSKGGAAASRIAGGVGTAANYLRDSDTDTMKHDLEGRVRQSPVQTLLILFAAGFLVGRILR